MISRENTLLHREISQDPQADLNIFCSLQLGDTGKVGVLPGLDHNLPMARQSSRSNQNIFQGMVICHIVQSMLTAKYKGLASAGYQRCRVPGDWVEKSG